VVAGAFQIIFRAKMHANDVFSFFKNHFWHQHIKTIQNIQTILNFSKKKIQIFWERELNRVPKRSLNTFTSLQNSLHLRNRYIFRMEKKKKVSQVSFTYLNWSMRNILQSNHVLIFIPTSPNLMIPVYINIQKGIINCTVFGLHCKAWDVIKHKNESARSWNCATPGKFISVNSMSFWITVIKNETQKN
jgi:hypothetical protein